MTIDPSAGTIERLRVHGGTPPSVVVDYMAHWVPKHVRIAASLIMPLLEPFTEAQTLGGATLQAQ